MDIRSPNKAADCLSRLVELPHDRQATVQMLSATNHDGPAFHTRSRTALCNVTEDLTPHPKTDRAILDIPKVTDTPEATPIPLTEDRLQNYYRCRGQIPSVNTSPNIYQMEKHQNMKLISSYMSKDYSINMSWIQTRSSWPLSYLKHRKTQCS